MHTALLFSYIGASLLLIFMPGPDNIFVLTESLSKGWRNGVAVSCGLASGIIVHTLAAATGLSIIIQQSALAFSVVKYMGAAYLLFLAYKSAREGRPLIDTQNGIGGNLRFFALYRKGLLMNVLNPKVALFFIAFFPQFVSPGGFNPIWQMIVLGAIFMLLTLLVFGLIAILSGRLTRYLSRPRFWEVTKWSKVAVLAALGITLALSRK